MKLFDRIANYPRKLTKHETKLADYILSGYPQHLLESATAIANKVGVSASTVVRFFAKLDYASLGEVQDEARLDLASKLTSPSQRAKLASKNKHSLSNVLERSLELDRENLSATIETIDLKAFEALIRKLTQPETRRIYLVAAKNSSAVVHYLYTHLNMCLPNVHALPTGTALADQLLWSTSEDVLLAITIRRYSRTVVQTAQHFRNLGATVACITDSPLAPVANLSDHRLLIHTSSTSPFDSYTAAFSLCNAIVAAVAIERQKEVKQSLKLGDELWTEFGVFTESNA
ncbi:MurR/RpiR family transcriptional regulator [Alcaligenaceae bacterium]|uniref:MurR/RpiR family transcriptional regulator n=1 Tax=Parapusillimonas sp. JC17 TaxID=3445768 RepID=UPI0015D3C568|nr:MurR/RpiR family transcriptional regulator [Alcaligenaceae bacterium]